MRAIKYILLILLLVSVAEAGEVILGYSSEGVGTSTIENKLDIIVYRSTDDNTPSDSAAIDSIMAFLKMTSNDIAAPFWKFSLGLYDASDSTLVCTTATVSTAAANYPSGVWIRGATIPDGNLPCTCSSSKQYHIAIVNNLEAIGFPDPATLKYVYDTDGSAPYDSIQWKDGITWEDPLGAVTSQLGRKMSMYAWGNYITTATPQVIMIRGD